MSIYPILTGFNGSWPGSTVQFIPWKNPAHCLFFYFFRKRKGKHCAGFFQGISPGPFIGPVEIRGKKNKKIYISFLPPAVY